MLTRKQIQLLEFIQVRMARDGVPPSFDEMKLALDLRSKSGIHRLVTALEERGFIRRLAAARFDFDPIGGVMRAQLSCLILALAACHAEEPPSQARKLSPCDRLERAPG